MCTLIAGRDVLGPGTLVAAANRDEDPARPADPPALLAEVPRIAGGRDRVAGGTWLAVRADRAVAMLNRRGADPLPPPQRSRGLLALDLAAAADARARVQGEVERVRYAPFTAAFLAAHDAWVLAWDGARARETTLGPGWHVVTHAELDDREEPRTARLLDSLASWRPASASEAEAGLRERLALHDPPAVCLHEGVMRTVSWSIVVFGLGAVRYLHGEGRPCEHAARDVSALLADAPRAGGGAAREARAPRSGA